jgi:hypothetical protein
MNETAYIRATNLAKIRIANQICRDITPTCGGSDLGAKASEIASIVVLLNNIEEKLNRLID